MTAKKIDPKQENPFNCKTKKYRKTFRSTQKQVHLNSNKIFYLPFRFIRISNNTNEDHLFHQ